MSNSLESKEVRDAVMGFSKRAEMRKSAKDILEEAKKAKKTLKDRDLKGLSDEQKKEHEKQLREQSRKVSETKAIHREFGGIDGISVVNGVVNIGISVGGGAIAANLLDGDYLSRIVSNTVACVGVDALAHLVVKNGTGIPGEGWKKNAFKGVVYTVRIAGASAAAGAIAHYGFKKDPLEAAITAAITQVVKIGLEYGRDAIMNW